ncbi:MAG TPA: TonB-dependent receptor, partial [Rhizomicrobium sp.]|nr:TonB-dependent receptor [Rhizomicrobium sp.]
GGNYMHYETYEEYYVFINTLSALAANAIVSGTTGNPGSPPYVAGVTDNTNCLRSGTQYGNPNYTAPVLGCIYIDPNPIDKVNGQGHNYFLSKNPYVLNSYALFGEAYYNITQDLKLTGGLRWTEDRKHAPQIPSELLVANTSGYPALAPVDQQWDQFTGRVAANWTPKLDFTDQTLVYGSYAHGYKAGGANPPQPRIVVQGDVGGPQSGKATIHPATFKPEFVDAFELGTKNTMLDDALTLNASAFYYNYTDYQISEIVDRTAVNQNFDAHIKGAELEMVWEPTPGLRFNLGAGYEDARLAKGSKAIDLMDRTAGNPDWMVVKPFPTNSSNCVIPISLYVNRNAYAVCEQYHTHVTAIPGFDTTAANNGEGFYKDLSGNMLPNAPPYTMSFGAQYSLPVSSDWAATARADVYWQADSWWRVFNDLSYDKLHGYSNLNLTLILTNQGGWQVMLYDKNVLNTTAITGAFLNSDDTSLTTNVFLTDPNLFGIRVTKNW